jgi:predicted PilT family ATPase
MTIMKKRAVVLHQGFLDLVEKRANLGHSRPTNDLQYLKTLDDFKEKYLVDENSVKTWDTNKLVQ